jgi:Flp pilus assembly protein TadG
MKKINAKRRGVSIIYAIVIMSAICMILSLAVDYGHAQLVKTELRRAADAGARAAAGLIYSDLNAATAAAQTIAARNNADGTAVNLVSGQDIQYGFWDVKAKTFTPTTGSTMNAVRVIARRTSARGNAIGLLFARVLGPSTCDVQAETIVMSVKPINVMQNVSAQADPFLAGMPAGSIASEINPANDPDYAGTASNPLQSPIAVNLPINEGDLLTFDSISGTAAHDPSLAYVNPDGDLSEQIGHNNLSTNYYNNYGPMTYSENGVADAWIPINSVIGVFLDDKAPNMSPTPSVLDFRDPASRDFDQLKPGLKQIFFIGDGKNSKGAQQKFQAPKGATRLYLGMMDYYQWSNNMGSRDIRISRPAQIIMVK